MTLFISRLGFLFLLCITIMERPVNATDNAPQPPVARKIPHATHIHGETLVDDYFWMREKENPEVIEHLKAENAYADAMMQPTRPFQDALYKEMLARIQETDIDVPYRKGAHLYYTRTEQGKQYPIHCRKPGDAPQSASSQSAFRIPHSAFPEEITLDLNAMAQGRAFFSLGDYDVSDDGNLLIYTTDVSGFRQYTLHVKNLRTGEILPDLAERVTSAAWATDNKTIFYVQEDPVTKRSHKFFRHELGSAAHELLYEETDELYELEVGRTRSRGFIVLQSASHTTSEIRLIPADRPAESPRLIHPRREGHEYYVDHLGDRFLIRTNDQGKNFRLVSAPVHDPRPENWRELVPHRPDVMLDDIDCFAGRYIVHERAQGVPRLRVTDLSTGETLPIEFPEPVYVVHPDHNEEFETSTFRLRYMSLVTPMSVYDYDMQARRLTLLKRQPVLGGYDPAQYASERIEAAAPDGSKIPISLVYKKDLARDGRRPLLLEAYGSYGYPYDVDFSSVRLSLLDRGVIFAIAHIRGGGDLGKEWHDQGKMMHKKNTFTDFIACAEHLINQRYTAPDRLVITGGSAGGLLMGAVANMRPELFKAVVSYVPFVDVINTMLDATIPLTVGEYLEWGNPNEKPAYDYMKSYSPYDNIEARAYPAMLIRTSYNDSQVMYWEPAKYVARLRAMKTDTNPLLFKIKLEPGGHGGASGRYDRLRDEAFDQAFILTRLGITQ